VAPAITRPTTLDLTGDLSKWKNAEYSLYRVVHVVDRVYHGSVTLHHIGVTLHHNAVRVRVIAVRVRHDAVSIALYGYWIALRPGGVRLRASSQARKAAAVRSNVIQNPGHQAGTPGLATTWA
jgi:hypothetical protein